MATGGQKRTRSERVAALELPPGQWERAWTGLRRRDVLGRIALALAAAAAVCAIIRAWDPPFPWREGVVPMRNIVAREPFSYENELGTQQAREQAKSEVRSVFANDPEPLARLQNGLRGALDTIAKSDKLTEANRPTWNKFQPPEAGAKPSPPAEEARFEAFRKAVKENRERLDRGVADALAPFLKHGLWRQVPDPLLKADGNKDEIAVYPVGAPGMQELVKVSDVHRDALQQSLREHVKPKELADRIFAWLDPQLPDSTLAEDKEETSRAQEEAQRRVPPKMFSYGANDRLAKMGERLDDQQIKLLEREHAAFVAARTWTQRVSRGGAALAVIFVLFVLCGVYMRYRQRGPLASLTRLTVMLLLAVGAVALSRWAAADPWRAELAPLLLFAMTMSIVYRQELALLLSGVLAWIIVLALGYHGLPSFLLFFGTATAASVNLGRIRSRSKLIYVGLFAGGVAALLDIAMSMIDNQPVGPALLEDAARNGMWAVAAGFLMTGLLPFIERTFGVLTDLSLLELGDVTHPLLQELVRRAPSTYNHSITVGSIAEAAAESIGARGLLVRVGAYFHDIGKMLKPGYFIENQGNEASMHETLVPAMSTLVIIAHIKDGSDLARQHHLPQPIIDLIAQHHGTTLVEYFYDRAQQSGGDANGSEVDENVFRYPGPKPQTKEAAVLMLADAVESASRALVDPTPARIESLVRDIAQRRLHGGQFDESGLTLRELRTIERGMIMSLTAIYHGRLKYPEPREREPREQKTA